MGWWQVNADTLAGSRFVVSPLAETFASLKMLHAGTGTHPGERTWLTAHLPAYRAELARRPLTALLIRSGLGQKWIADFLTPTPREDETFADEIARVRDADPAAARAHLTVSLRGPLPAALHRDDLPARAADLLTFVWEETVRPYWERRRRVLEADVLARTAQLGQGGWAAVLDAMRPGMRWLGENRLQVNLHEYPPREISGARLVFVPVTPQRTGWVAWEEGQRYAVVYPCSGVLADADGNGNGTTAVPAALGPLLGEARARVLVLLDSPMSTTHLCAVTGQRLGSVGRHLKVLLDAGLVRRGRAGRSVLYARTAAGEVLVRATPSAHPTATPSARPTATASTRPAATPSTRPTTAPSADPAATPSARPTATPSTRPTATPSTRPTTAPSADPAATPSARPTATPSTRPAATPSARPAFEDTENEAEGRQGGSGGAAPRDGTGRGGGGETSSGDSIRL